MFCEKFPRILSYKKQKDGNYSFEGMFYEIMQDVNVFFDIKYVELFILSSLILYIFVLVSTAIWSKTAFKVFVSTYHT